MKTAIRENDNFIHTDGEGLQYSVLSNGEVVRLLFNRGTSPETLKGRAKVSVRRKV